MAVTSTSPIPSIDIGTLITRSPDMHDGRPFISGRSVSVMRIAGWYKQGWIPEEIARRLELTLAQVHAALAYYHSNREEIEADLAAEAAEYDRLRHEHEQNTKDQDKG